jgi:hypothetical protein
MREFLNGLIEGINKKAEINIPTFQLGSSPAGRILRNLKLRRQIKTQGGRGRRR